MTYEKTHTHFKITMTWDSTDSMTTIWSNKLAKTCESMIGATGITEPLHERKWFTDYSGVWIRNDCLNEKLGTWLMLAAD